MTLYLLYTDFVAQIRSSSGLFLCSWLTCGIAMAYLWPRSGRCGPDLGRHNVAMWVLMWIMTPFPKNDLCINKNENTYR